MSFNVESATFFALRLFLLGVLTKESYFFWINTESGLFEALTIVAMWISESDFYMYTPNNFSKLLSFSLSNGNAA